MEEKIEKRPWQLAKERSLPLVIAKLSSMGYAYKPDEVGKMMVTKNLTKYRKYLLNDYEFKGTNLFITFNEDYSSFVDVEGNLRDEPQIYTMGKLDNYADIYENLNLHGYGPYAVPVTDFKLLPYKEGFYPPRTKPKQVKLKGMTGSLDLEYPKVDVENWDENFSSMTIKDFIAIYHCFPVSDKPEINELIKRINVSRSKN